MICNHNKEKEREGENAKIEITKSLKKKRFKSLKVVQREAAKKLFKVARLS